MLELTLMQVSFGVKGRQSMWTSFRVVSLFMIQVDVMAAVQLSTKLEFKSEHSSTTKRYLLVFVKFRKWIDYNKI